jgi:hypothetical protein
MVHDDVAAVLPTYSATLKMTLDSRALKGYQHQHHDHCSFDETFVWA